MTVYGNIDTGETIEIDHMPGRGYTAVQLSTGTETKPKGLLFHTTAHKVMKQWWDQYKLDSKHTWQKLVKMTFMGEPITEQITDARQEPQVPYTEHSGTVGTPGAPEYVEPTS